MSSGIEALRGELGDHLLEAPQQAVEGCELRASLAPESGEALSAGLELLSRCGVGALVRGGGSRMEFGNAASGAQVLLSLERLAGIDRFDRGDGVVQVRAGTPLEELRSSVRAEGWELPLDPWGPASTIGGTLASAAAGPRQQGFGATKGCVLGLDVVLGQGERTRCGGRVVKNVTGFDLARLYVGSLGSLGVIEGGWLRLGALPDEIRVYTAALPRRATAIARSLEAARRSSARVAALLSSEARRALARAPSCDNDADELLVVELAGDVPAVARDGDWLRDELGAGCLWAGPGSEDGAEGDEGPVFIEQLRELQAKGLGRGGVRVKLATLPSKLESLCEALLKPEAVDSALESRPASNSPPGLLVYPGLGLVYTGWGDRSLDEGREIAGRTCELARAFGASVFFEQIPLRLKEEWDVFGERDASFALNEKLKRRFDPKGVLNPGRMWGRL